MVVIQYEVRFFGDSIEALDDKGESLFDGEPLLSLEKGPQSLSERLAFLRKARKEIAEEEVSFVVGPVEGVPYSVQSLLSNPLAGQRGLPGARWSCDEDQPALLLTGELLKETPAVYHPGSQRRHVELRGDKHGKSTLRDYWCE